MLAEVAKGVEVEAEAGKVHVQLAMVRVAAAQPEADAPRA